MIVWVALSAAGVLTLIALRSMVLAFAVSLDSRPHHSNASAAKQSRPVVRRRRRGYLASQEAALLMVEIALSIGIALLIVGLASMAALPPRLMIGALLAQLAVLGSLVAPPVSTPVFGVSLRPAAMALAVAQLANAAFFIKAIHSLMS